MQDVHDPIGYGGLLIEEACDISLISRAAPQNAVPLGPLVPELHVFGHELNQRAWQGHLQRGCIRLEEHDGSLLRDALVVALVGDVAANAASYFSHLSGDLNNDR